MPVRGTHGTGIPCTCIIRDMADTMVRQAFFETCSIMVGRLAVVHNGHLILISDDQGACIASIPGVPLIGRLHSLQILTGPLAPQDMALISTQAIKSALRLLQHSPCLTAGGDSDIELCN